MTTGTDPVALLHHGDADATPGLLDFAVNVTLDRPPPWLREAITAGLADLARYPDNRAAHAAVAARHQRPSDEVLLTVGAAEAFVLIARAATPQRAVVVHPQFTEPEAALRAAGHPVERVQLAPADGFALDPDRVPADADLVIIGNPTNPTSALHPAETVRRLIRPGRTLVIDEAFMDTVPGEPDSLAAVRGLPGVLVVRSLTKTWGLAGLRIGYLLGDANQLDGLRRGQPLWPVSTPALAAAAACSTPAAVAEAGRRAGEIADNRAHLITELARIGVAVAGDPRASFVLVRVADGERLRIRLRDRGIAVRRGDTFPGLDSTWLRIAVRPPELTDHLIAEIDQLGAL